MCLFYHKWGDVYEVIEDVSVYRDIANDPMFEKEARDAANLFLKTYTNVNPIKLRRCLDCDYIEIHRHGQWSEYLPPIDKSRIRDFKINRVLDIK